MKQYLGLAGLLVLGACAGQPEAPKIVVATDTGVASVPAPNAADATNGLSFIRTTLGNDLSLDDAAAYNAAVAVNDNLGIACTADIMGLINAANDAAAKAGQVQLGSIHLIYDAQMLRNKLMALQGAAGKPGAFMQAFLDCNAVIQDDVNRGIQVSQQLRDLVASLGGMAVGADLKLFGAIAP